MMVMLISIVVILSTISRNCACDFRSREEKTKNSKKRRRVNLERPQLVANGGGGGRKGWWRWSCNYYCSLE